jgi:hypothetical protein
LFRDVHDKLSDTTLLKELGELGFLKTEVMGNKFVQINEIFCERYHSKIESKTCSPVYRDILIFKKNNRIVGTAKICFVCSRSVIAGTLQNTDAFGQSGDYERLYKLLHG